MLYRVELIIPVIVRDAQSPSGALRVAISKIGNRLNGKKLKVSRVSCSCGREIDAVLFTPALSLVCVETSVVVAATSADEAEKVAKAIVGKKLEGVPICTKSITIMGEKEGD